MFEIAAAQKVVRKFDYCRSAILEKKRNKEDLRGFEGVIGWKMNVQEEDTTRERTVTLPKKKDVFIGAFYSAEEKDYRSHDCCLPVKQVITLWSRTAIFRRVCPKIL